MDRQGAQNAMARRARPWLLLACTGCARGGLPPPPPPGFSQTPLLSNPGVQQHVEPTPSGALAGGALGNETGSGGQQPLDVPTWWLVGAAMLWKILPAIGVGIGVLCACCCCLRLARRLRTGCCDGRADGDSGYPHDDWRRRRHSWSRRSGTCPSRQRRRDTDEESPPSPKQHADWRMRV